MVIRLTDEQWSAKKTAVRLTDGRSVDGPFDDWTCPVVESPQFSSGKRKLSEGQVWYACLRITKLKTLLSQSLTGTFLMKNNYSHDPKSEPVLFSDGQYWFG
jgi:hypothetical protein